MSGPFTPQSLAERWDCHPRTVRNLIRKGELRPFRIGALVRISMDEVAQFLGHTNSSVTFRVYARFSPDHLRNALEGLE